MCFASALSLLVGGLVWMAGPVAATPTLSPPSIKQSAATVVVGKNKEVHITATGYPKPTFAEMGALPAGMAFNSGSGSATISGVPAPGTGNDYFITITATNSQGTDTEPYDLTVFQTPVFASNFCPGPMTVGQYTHDDQSDIAYPPFFGLDENNSLPSGISFNQDVNNEDAGVLSGTPESGSGGNYGLQYSSDANNTTRNLHCKLVVDEAPTFTDSGMATVTAGAAPSAPVSITGTPGFPKMVNVTVTGAAPTGMMLHSVHNGKGFAVNLSGTPAAGTQGDYPIDVTASNGLSTAQDFVLVVQGSGATPQPTTLTLSGGTSPVPYQSSMETFTATVTGGTSPSGYVQFSIGNGIATVPLAAGQASFTTPANLDAGDYTVTATYTGDALNASSTAATDLTVDPAPTALTLTPSASSTAFGVPVTYTATVTCSPSCGGLTPAGDVDFSQLGTDTSVELVNGQATFTTDPTIGPGLQNEVDATFSSYSDAPGDFATTSPAVQAFYDIGAVGLTTGTEDLTTSGVQSVTDSGTVTVVPSDPNEISVQMGAVASGNGTPPGPLSVDVVDGTTDETAAVGITTPSESAPSADAATGQTDYFWTIPADALSGLPGTSATVTISYAGSTDFAPTTFTFTLDW